jgi:hypothetical protein
LCTSSPVACSTYFRASAVLSIIHFCLWWDSFVTCRLKSPQMTSSSRLSFLFHYLALSMSTLKQSVFIIKPYKGHYHRNKNTNSPFLPWNKLSSNQVSQGEILPLIQTASG